MTAPLTLVLADTAGIQRYIFASNRLRDQVGASFLVKQATEAWVRDALKNVAPGFVAAGAPDGFAFDASGTPTRTPVAEAVYLGGGNALLLFREEPTAGAFARALGKRVLCEAPGLQLVVATSPFDPAQPLPGQIDALFRQLNQQKRTDPPSAETRGLSVTLPCATTGLPAVAVSDLPGGDAQPASAEIVAKRAVYERAKEDLRRALPPGDGFDYPDDFETLGRSFGDVSLLGVVHLDGNGIGQKLRALGNAFRTSHDHRGYLDALRTFSANLQTAATAAQQRLVQALTARIDVDGLRFRQGAARIEIDLQSVTDRRYGPQVLLPLRPLIFGGDDLTFVCDARLALGLAAAYAPLFEEETARVFDGERLTVGGGVSIVKVKYPFARAYALAEELTKNAKALAKSQTNGAAGSVLDWHLAYSGLAGDLDEIRAREYDVQHTQGLGHLHLRPVWLTHPPETGEGLLRRFETVAQGVEGFRGQDWGERRNKVKRLREVLRDGPEATRQFIDVQPHQLPVLHLNADVQLKGWQDKRCAYFDALELLDLLIPPTFFAPSAS